MCGMMQPAWLATVQISRTFHLALGWATGSRLGSPILLVSRVTVGTAAVSTKDVEVGEGADAAGEAARPTAILSCTAIPIPVPLTQFSYTQRLGSDAQPAADSRS